MQNRWCVMTRMNNPRISPKLSLGLVPVSTQAEPKFHTVDVSKRRGLFDSKVLIVSTHKFSNAGHGFPLVHYPDSAQIGSSKFFVIKHYVKIELCLQTHSISNISQKDRIISQ